MSLLKQDTIKKGQINKNKIIKLDVSNKNSKKYKTEIIYNNIVYTRELELSHLLRLYYLVFAKDFLKKENT